MDDNKGTSTLWLLSTLRRRAARADRRRREGRPSALVAARRPDRLHRQARAGRQEGRDGTAVPDRARRRRSAPRDDRGHRRRGLQVVSATAGASLSCRGSGPTRRARRRRRSGTRPSRSARKPATSPPRRGTAGGTATCRWAASRTCTCWMCESRPGARPVRRQRLRADARRPGRQRVRRLARWPAHRLRLRPGAARSASDNRYALAEIDVKTGKVTTIARDADWSFGSPCYSPDGTRIAFIASHQGVKHTMPAQLALLERGALAGAERRLGP